MQEWIDYPPSEIERDEREAAKVGAAGLQAYLQGLEGAAKKPEADDLVNVVSLAVRTDGPGAQEIVMAALDLLQGFEWFAGHRLGTRVRHRRRRHRRCQGAAPSQSG